MHQDGYCVPGNNRGYLGGEMLKYIVIEETDTTDLTRKVNDAIESGYLPIGGVSKWNKGGARGLTQALLHADAVKDKKWWKL